MKAICSQAVHHFKSNRESTQRKLHQNSLLTTSDSSESMTISEKVSTTKLNHEIIDNCSAISQTKSYNPRDSYLSLISSLNENHQEIVYNEASASSIECEDVDAKNSAPTEANDQDKILSPAVLGSTQSFHELELSHDCYNVMTDVPNLIFNVKRKHVKERLTACATLLQFAEYVCTSQRSALKCEENASTFEEAQNSHNDQYGLPLAFKDFEDYWKTLQDFICSTKTLRYLKCSSRDHLDHAFSREESLRVLRQIFLVRIEVLQPHIDQLDKDVRYLTALRRKTLQKGSQYAQQRYETNACLKSLISVSKELKCMKDDVSDRQKTAQRIRHRWMSLEQMISELPEKKKQMTLRMQKMTQKIKQLQMENDNYDLQISRLQFQSKAQTIDPKCNNACCADFIARLLHTIKNWSHLVGYPLNILLTDNDEQDIDGISPQIEPSSALKTSESSHASLVNLALDTQNVNTLHKASSKNLSSLKNYSFDVEKFKDPQLQPEVASLIDNLLPEAVKEYYPSVHDILQFPLAHDWIDQIYVALLQCYHELKKVNVDDLALQLTQAQSSKSSICREMKTLNAQLEQFNRYLQEETNPESLLAQSQNLQSELREADSELNTSTTALEALESNFQSHEFELDKQKSSARALENEFFCLKNTLIQAIDEANVRRGKIVAKIHQLEQEVKGYIFSMAVSQEERALIPIHRMMIQTSIDETEKTCEALIEQTKKLKSLLGITAELLEDIKKSPVSLRS